MLILIIHSEHCDFVFKSVPADGLALLGGWNPSSCKTRTYLFYIVNIIAADDLATPGARASATVIFTMLNRINSVSHVKG